jgi:hypothetical protein
MDGIGTTPYTKIEPGFPLEGGIKRDDIEGDELIPGANGSQWLDHLNSPLTDRDESFLKESAFGIPSMLRLLPRQLMLDTYPRDSLDPIRILGALVKIDHASSS